jgi:hypothetical protein
MLMGAGGEGEWFGVREGKSGSAFAREERFGVRGGRGCEREKV